MNKYSNTTNNKPTSSFREVGEKASRIAFLLGMAIIIVPIILGRSFEFVAFLLVMSISMTLLWKKVPRPWINLVSMSAATPMTLFPQQFTCNLIFAFWSLLFNPKLLFRLPKWIYLPSGLIILGILSSMTNWMSSDVVSKMIREGAFVTNLFLGPFLLLPAVYLRMKESLDYEANLKGLLFFLIIPTTVLLISAKLFGSIANWWEASQAVRLSQGYLLYKLGNVYVSFVRTEIGFILAALICASTAIAISQVKSLYRLLSAACLTLNIFLLLSTGSIGSSTACFLGLTAIFLTQANKVSINKVFTSVVIICFTLILSYVFAPQSTKEYLGQRFEHRVKNASVDTDRFILWGEGIDAFLEHPEGVGLTYKGVGGQYIHNDYIVYAVSYGLFGGIAYMVLIIGLIISFLRRKKNIYNEPAALAVYLAGLGVIVALAFNSITDHSNSDRWYLNVIWSIIWYCYFCSYPKEKKKSIPVAISRRGN